MHAYSGKRVYVPITGTKWENIKMVENHLISASNSLLAFTR